ncbi:MAG: ethanolamine permease, partial [Bdellovibrionota bacterium]|nr:ethanolamine permease [Bdellovibrionota bacterium]
KSGSTELSDAPLPLALQQILGKNSDLLKALVGIGLFGLIASFHGIILAAGRTTFEFGRMGYAPSFLGKIHPKYKTPALSLIVNMLIGIIALLTGKTGEIITIACFGALTLYFISMVSFFKLRKDSPTMPRPFKVMGYPYFPAIALILSLLCFVSMAVYNPTLFIIYLFLLFIPFLGFELFIYQRNKEAFSIN